jgi:hypothetical protein
MGLLVFGLKSMLDYGLSNTRYRLQIRLQSAFMQKDTG